MIGGHLERGKSKSVKVLGWQVSAVPWGSVAKVARRDCRMRGNTDVSGETPSSSKLIILGPYLGDAFLNRIMGDT